MSEGAEEASLPGEGAIPGRAKLRGPVEVAVQADVLAEEQETGQTGRRGAAVSSTPCSRPASPQPARPEPRGMMPVPAGCRGGPLATELQAEGQGMADTLLRPAGWDMAPLGRAALF